MVDMMSGEKGSNVFLSDLVRNSVLIVELKSVLLILKERPEDHSHYEVQE